MIEASPGRPVRLSRAQYDAYRAEVDAAPAQRRLEHIAGVVGSPDATAAALRGVLDGYPPELIGPGPDPHGLRNLIGTGGEHVSTRNKRGEWVPAIPLPYLGLRKRCGCGARFWTMRGYRGHYALTHILGQD